MPNTPNLKEEKNQPSLSKYLNKGKKPESNSNLTSSETPNRTNSTELKKRTPPSPSEQPLNKKINMSQSEMEVDDLTSLKEVHQEDSNSETEEEEMPELDEKAEMLQKAITIAMNRKMKDHLKPLKRDVKTLLNIKSSLSNQQAEIKTIKAENQELKTICTRMEREQDQLKQRILKLEDRRLECNLIFNGIPETGWESDEELVEKIYSVMAKTVDRDTEEKKLEHVKKVKIASVQRLGKPMENRKRPVQVIFDKANEAKVMMNNKKKLPKGVFMDQEYSPETEKARRQLRPFLNAAKKHSTYKQKCKMEGDSLIINSIKYNTLNLHELPEDLTGYNINGKSDTTTVAFFGGLNPFSNFHPCEFTLDNKKYNCSEQYIQSQKASYFKDKKTEEKIMKAISGLECKRLSKEIKNYSHEDWKKTAKQTSEPGITAKFLQNPKLLKTLVSTENKKLVESSKDTLWGTGIPLQSNDALTPAKWKNTGILGEILMDIRETWGSYAIPGENFNNELWKMYPNCLPESIAAPSSNVEAGPSETTS